MSATFGRIGSRNSWEGVRCGEHVVAENHGSSYRIGDGVGGGIEDRAESNFSDIALDGVDVQPRVLLS